MKRTLRLLFALVLTALAVAPVSAAPTRVDSLPAVTPASSARFDFALTAFGEVIGYGKGDVESASRIHLAFRTVAFGGNPAETVEVVIYDGVTYTRENDSTQWYIEPTPAAPLPDDSLPTADTEDIPITLIGEVDVAGVPTYQYQLWINGDDGSAATVDFFIGRQPSYLNKLVISFYDQGTDLIPLLGLDYRYYDFNNSTIKVYAPQGAVRRSASTANSLVGQLKLSVMQAREAALWMR